MLRIGPMSLSDLLWKTPAGGMLDAYRAERELQAWQKGPRITQAPTLVKRALLRSLAAKHGLRTLVETGTCLGGTAYALRNDFDRIITIELDPALHARAARRLAPCRHIRALQGDSAALLPGVLRELDAPALFFLDGHYSGGITARGAVVTPVVEELRCILADPERHVIVVDDARLFDGSDDYPTVPAVREMAKGRAVEQHTDLLVIA